ncbi:hypothetical protein HMPREF9081_1809 [Centipeda periodontii DSM 2778]|uniref:Uncharacterized protein n=1 Tax=Centipeda periodontii DSM 2778 TaxID=888060 RepID=F5RNH3_9FIRM|nr:hypothetical protein HMPREF9081_1809 [Centipeda periodontii DSM 2778]
MFLILEKVNRYFVWVKEAMMPLRLGNDDIKIQFSAFQDVKVHQDSMRQKTRTTYP